MKLKDVKKLLPGDGMRVISEKAKVSYVQVARIFNGLETKRTPEVVVATCELLEELESSIKEKRKALQATIAG